jgi:hypothetical protein
MSSTLQAPRLRVEDHEREQTTHRISELPMLTICTEPGCNTIVFGGGTCVRHDSAETLRQRRAPA